MAIEKKRMQQRYGTYDQFQKENLLPHEFASVTSGDPNTSDGKGLYFGYGSGDVKRIAFSDEINNGGGSGDGDGTGGTTNYNNLSNLPQINGITLAGNKTASDLNLQPAGNYITNEDIPKKLPNPKKIIFTGAVTAEYDGSSEQTVHIPESSGGDSYTLPIMSDTQLGGGKAVSKTDEDVPVAVDTKTGQLFVPTYPVQGGITEEQKQQLEQNTQDITDLKSALEQIGTLIPDDCISPEKTTFMTLRAGEASNANLLNPSLLVSFGYYNSEGEFDKSGELNGTNGGYRYIFTKSNGNLEFKKIYTTSSVDFQNANKCVKDKGKLNVNAGTTYCFQADKVISNSYQNPSSSYLLLYKIDGSFVKSIDFASSKEYITCVFTPDEDGYILVVLGEAASENEKTVNAYKNYMLSKNSGYVQYEEYGVSTNQTLDIAEKYKEGFVKNLSGIDLSSNNNFVCFSDCEYEDTDGILEESKEHMKNSKSTLKMSTIQTGTEYSVTFKNINLNVEEDNFGVWFWISRLDKGCTQGATTETNTYATVKISINSDYEHTYFRSSLKSGMNYYLIDSSNVPSKKISTVTITLSAASNGQNVSIYLDSIEKGYKTIPHVLINMDCSPKQLMTDKGYELLTKYDLTGTFDYHAFPNGGNSGTWNDELEAKTHMQLIAEGFDYGIYSQYKADSETTGQPQYYDTDYDKWYDHAVTMYESNNTLGIFAPTTVHSNFHYAGDAYERAMVDAGFLIVRTDNIMWDNAGSYKDCLFSYFDKDDYREIVPYWLQGAYTEDDNVAKAKELIDLAISRGQNVMICCHSIKDSEYEGASDATNVGENAMDPLFAYIKEKVDGGEIKCSTSADFIRDVAPDLYSWWNNKKNDLQYNYVINKIVT